MKNNKGFTLIELLAVMVVLAIIAVIAVPVVMNVIKNSRRASAENSAYGIIKAAEVYYTSKLLTDGSFNTVTSLSTSSLDYKGSTATGTLKITEEGEVSFNGALTINGFSCTYSNSKVTCS